MPGYTSIFKYYPKLKLALVLLINTATFPTADNARIEVVNRIESELN